MNTVLDGGAAKTLCMRTPMLSLTMTSIASLTYVYDALDRLVGVYRGATEEMNLHYDGLGRRRIERRLDQEQSTTSSVEVLLEYLGGNVIHETTLGTRTVRWAVTHGPGLDMPFRYRAHDPTLQHWLSPDLLLWALPDADWKANIKTMEQAEEEQVAMAIARADRLEETGDLAEALEIICHTIEQMKNNPRLWARNGYIQYHAGDPRAAIENYAEALRLKPAAPTTLFIRGRAREKLEDWSGAALDYLASYALDSSKSDVYLAIRRCLFQVGYVQFAVSYLQKCMDLFNGSEDADSARSLIAEI